MCIATCCVACQKQPSPTKIGVTIAVDGSLSPTDSAKWLMDKVDHYYKNVVHDSLYALAPVAMDYDLRHSLWREYYTTWCLLVNDLVWNGQMDKGLDEAQKMHQDAIKRQNAFGISEAYTAMGIAYHFQNNNAESVESYHLALEHYPDDADQSVKLNIYSYYCQVLADTGDHRTLREALSQWKGFLDHLTDGDTSNPDHAHKYFRFHRENYKYYLAIGDYRQAARELDTMQSYLDRENDSEVYQAQVAGLRTQLAMVRKDYTEAMAWSDREIEMSKNLDFNTFLNALKHRSDMLQQLGHYEEALKAWRNYDQQKDSIIKADTRDQLNELNKRFEVDELKAQQERTLLEHEHERLRSVLLFALMVVIALMLFILWRHRADLRLKEAHTLLEQSNNELQQSYEQLKIANVRAEESSKMKTEFIRQISHEIRTPLNVLSGFTQIVTTPGIELDEAEKTDISQRITENTDRITSLVNKMLELSEASSQTVIERNEDVLSLLIATQAVEDTGIDQNSHITFDLQPPADSSETIHHTNLRYAVRALAILLDNAQKFTKEGRITLKVEGNRFTVEDTGIGVPTTEAEHIFDEFVQLDNFYDGTGIGLTVARSIARRLGGDIVLDTNYTGGARFVMSLPTA